MMHAACLLCLQSQPLWLEHPQTRKATWRLFDGHRELLWQYPLHSCSILPWNRVSSLASRLDTAPSGLTSRFLPFSTSTLADNEGALIVYTALHTQLFLTYP